MWLHVLRAVVDATRGEPASAQVVVEQIWREQPGRVVDDLEFLTFAATIASWAGTPGTSLERLLPALEKHAGSSPVRRVAPALVAAARCAADAASGDTSVARDREVSTIRVLAERAGLHDDEHAHDGNIAAHAAQFRVELARADGVDRIEDWVHTASLWERLGRPHDKAYCMWRAARTAHREERGTLAARLLKTAAVDAGEHVPLAEAVAATASWPQAGE
jgi:hypothetical protein